MNLVPDAHGLLAVQPRKDFPTNKGGLCQKGWTSTDLLAHPDRLTAPLVRGTKDGPLRPASWDEALDRVAAGITASQKIYGRATVGRVGGVRLARLDRRRRVRRCDAVSEAARG